MKTTDTTPKTARIVADVCFYGAGAAGHGFLFHVDGVAGVHGDATPRRDRGLTEALWKAIDAIRWMVTARRGDLVRLHSPGGNMVAEVPLDYVGYAGNVAWRQNSGEVAR